MVCINDSCCSTVTSPATHGATAMTAGTAVLNTNGVDINGTVTNSRIGTTTSATGTPPEARRCAKLSLVDDTTVLVEELVCKV